MTIKETSIREYLKNIDLKSDSINFNAIEEDMRGFLGEAPAIDVEYEKDVMINEATKKSIEIKRLKNISVVFYDTDEKFKKLKFEI